MSDLTTAEQRRPPGRPRNEEADREIIAATLRLLPLQGYDRKLLGSRGEVDPKGRPLRLQVVLHVLQHARGACRGAPTQRRVASRAIES